VPAEVTFQTKPEQARVMLEHAWQAGVSMRWVTGDSVYGDVPRLRASIQAHGYWYVLAVTSLVRCWLNPPHLSCPRSRRAGVLDAPFGWLRTLPGPAPWVRCSPGCRASRGSG
jgi:SRSO17 transposase